MTRYAKNEQGMMGVGNSRHQKPLCRALPMWRMEWRRWRPAAQQYWKQQHASCRQSVTVGIYSFKLGACSRQPCWNSCGPHWGFKSCLPRELIHPGESRLQSYSTLNCLRLIPSAMTKTAARTALKNDYDFYVHVCYSKFTKWIM